MSIFLRTERPKEVRLTTTSNEDINLKRFIEASRTGDLTAMKKLYAVYEELPHKYYENENALMVACEYGHIDIVKYLFEHCNMKAKNSTDESEIEKPIHLSCKSGHLDIVKYLHEKGTSMNQIGKVVKVKHRRWTYITGRRTPLHVACLNNHLSVVQYLLQNNADVSLQDADGDTALHIACRNGFVNIVKEIIAVEIVVRKANNSDELVFDVATDCGVLDVLKPHVDINRANKVGCSALHMCAKQERLIMKLKWLIENGINIHAVDSTQATALHYACSYANLKAVHLLVDSGVSVNALDSNGAGALHYACMVSGDVDNCSMLQFLLDQGVHVDRCDNKGETALCYASKSGNYLSVKFLLNQGATIDSQDFLEDKNCNGSALIYACCNGYDKIVALLLENGANVHVAGGYLGFTPIKYALNFTRDNFSDSYLRILKALVQKGAFIDTTKVDELCAFLMTCKIKEMEKVFECITTIKNIVEKVPEEDRAGKQDGNNFIYDIIMYLLQHNAVLPSSTGGIFHGSYGQSRDRGNIDWDETIFVRHLSKAPLIVLKLLKRANFFLPFLMTVLSKEEEQDWKSFYVELREEMEQVPSLMNICRLSVRDNIGPQFAYKLEQLPLPASVKQFLMISELEEL